MLICASLHEILNFLKMIYVSRQNLSNHCIYLEMLRLIFCIMDINKTPLNLQNSEENDLS